MCGNLLSGNYNQLKSDTSVVNMSAWVQLLYCVSLVLGSSLAEITARNERPIIGILAQESYSINKFFPNEDVHSFIAASYVKFVESSGGRVLPIMIGHDKDYYYNIINKTNGLLLPGGGVWFNETKGYAEAGQHLYDAALALNKAGDFYPIWGTCLGMELIPYVALNGEELRAHCYSKKISLPLDFKPDYKSSRLFSTAPNEIINILKTENVTVNSHGFCFTEANFTRYNLTDEWKVLSTNVDRDGLEFISSYEHKSLPFYGVQFHPEKNLFEFERAPTTLHTSNAIKTSSYFADFFVDECRKNGHNFEKELAKDLIYKYAPRYIGILGSIYEQVYIFSSKD